MVREWHAPRLVPDSDRHEGAAKKAPRTRYSLSTARIFHRSSANEVRRGLLSRVLATLQDPSPWNRFILQRSFKPGRQAIELLAVTFIALPAPNIVKISARYSSASAPGDPFADKCLHIIPKMPEHDSSECLLEPTQPQRHFLRATTLEPDAIHRMG